MWFLSTELRLSVLPGSVSLAEGSFRRAKVADTTARGGLVSRDTVRSTRCSRWRGSDSSRPALLIRAREVERVAETTFNNCRVLGGAQLIPVYRCR
jgi:hypothetical protein